MKYITVRMIIISALVTIFGVLTVALHIKSVLVLEKQIYTQVARHISPAFTALMLFITNAVSFAAVSTIIIAFLLLPRTRFACGVPLAVTVALSVGLNIALKMLIARPRPDVLRLAVETGYGFPSGHAMVSAALYTMINLTAFLRIKNVKICCTILVFSLILVFSIGISRIYLGVHNAGDVIGGWIMGVAVALTIDAFRQAALEKAEKERLKNEQELNGADLSYRNCEKKGEKYGA